MAGVILSQAVSMALKKGYLLSAIEVETILAVFYVVPAVVLMIFVVVPYLLLRPSGSVKHIADLLLVVACTYLGALLMQWSTQGIPGSIDVMDAFYGGLKGTWLALLPLVYWASNRRKRG